MKREDKDLYIREVAIRYKKKRVPKKLNYCINGEATSAERVANIFRKELQSEIVEVFIVAHLNIKNIIESFQLISRGSVSKADVCKRNVFQAALLSNCTGIILVHNHPSGDSKPSPDDYKITEELREAGKLLEIKIVDHVIIGKENYYSINNGYRCVY